MLSKATFRSHAPQRQRNSSRARPFPRGAPANSRSLQKGRTAVPNTSELASEEFRDCTMTL